MSLTKTKSSAYIALLLVHFCRCSCRSSGEESLNLSSMTGSERVNQTCFGGRGFD